VDEGEISFGELVEAGEDSALVFEKAEHDRDFVAFLVEPPVGLPSA
jgi:hypothetical protein